MDPQIGSTGPHPRVIVLAGPSGSGKSHLAERLARRFAMPVLRLDDFYKDGDDPTLPVLDLAGGAPIVDWDDAGSWHRDHAVTAVEELCRTGATDVPTYDIAQSARIGSQHLSLDGAAYFLAEGIFAQEVVRACRARGLLADAICVTQHPAVTFTRRLARDLREHRKPPFVLLRRGLHLMKAQRAVVARATALGCRVAGPEAAYDAISALLEEPAGLSRPR